MLIYKFSWISYFFVRCADFALRGSLLDRWVEFGCLGNRRRLVINGLKIKIVVKTEFPAECWRACPASYDLGGSVRDGRPLTAQLLLPSYLHTYSNVANAVCGKFLNLGKFLIFTMREIKFISPFGETPHFLISNIPNLGNYTIFSWMRKSGLLMDLMNS